MPGRISKAGIMLLFATGITSISASPDPWRVTGPEECAECHDVEYGIWEETPHSLTYESMPDSDEGIEIGEKMGLDDVVESELCQSCHLTLQSEGVDEPADVIAGVSCDSCHGASVDWIDPHSKEDKTPEQQQSLWAESEGAGMIRPGNVYALAKNCLGCHLVPRETLVNTGGHAAGSEFNLVTWSQGVVRHNTFYSADNSEATPERKRMMAVMGVAAELQLGLNAAAEIEHSSSDYAVALNERLLQAKSALSEMATITSVPGVQAIYAAVAGLDMNLPMDKTKAAAAAAAVATSAAALSLQGADLSALDALIGSYGEYRGEPQT